MIYTCTLNGVPLSGVCDQLTILDIQEDAPKLHAACFPLAGEGQQLLSRCRESLTVHIRFALHLEDPALRSEALSLVSQWAEAGGVLRISPRPGMQLPVYCAALPARTARAWDEALTLSFTTTHCPYWEDDAAAQASGQGAVTLYVPGTASAAPVSAAVINAGDETVTKLTLRCGDTRMIFDGIALAPSQVFTLMYVDGVPHAMIGAESVLYCRTPESDDLLLAPCGKSCTAYASATEALQASFSARGRYL